MASIVLDYWLKELEGVEAGRRTGLTGECVEIPTGLSPADGW
jgi:hypothetical protein